MAGGTVQSPAGSAQQGIEINVVDIAIGLKVI